MSRILYMADEFWWLNNFSRYKVLYQNTTFRTSEHAYQASKFRPGSPEWEDVRKATTPGLSKKVARNLAMFYSKQEWDGPRKVSHMRHVLLAKLQTNPQLYPKLLALDGVDIEEGNSHGDRTWGKVNGQGWNLLGRLWMDLATCCSQIPYLDFMDGERGIARFHEVYYHKRDRRELQYHPEIMIQVHPPGSSVYQT